MKGNQGLDALAALCGGATKAEAGDSQTTSPKSPALQQTASKTESMIPEIPSFQEQCATSGQNCGQNNTVTGTSTPQHETQKWQTNQQIQNQSQTQMQSQAQTQTPASPYISTVPNVAAILSAAGSAIPQQSLSNFSPQLPSTDQSNAIQQLAYFNLLQNQASSTNQMISHHSPASQNGLQSNTQYNLDPNTAMAIVLAVQQQAQQAQQTQHLQQAQHVQQQQPQLQHTQQNQQAQIPQTQSSSPALGVNNIAMFPNLQTHNKVHDQQQQQQRKQYHQIVPSATPTLNLQAEADKECMKPPALPFIANRQNSSSDVSVNVQSAIASGSTTVDTKPQQGSSVDNDPSGVTTSKVNRPVSVPAPLHQPILMRRPHRRDSVRSKLKEEADSSPKSDEQNDDDHEIADGSMLGSEEKKQMKRAANRRSAQLSRKRKKQFIEELNKENDELRRKEQILRSIPDLVLVFDSAGKLWFVSHSVTRFLKYTPTELEGTSLWDRLCDESVRLLKSAFMDALAARTSDSETTPLGSGVWELRMQDKDGTHKWVMLNGVVHFSGDAPECVCSVRPRDRLTNSCNKPSLLSNAIERKGEIDISKDANVARVNDQHNSQPSIQTHQSGPRIAPAGNRFVQVSDTSSIISE